MQVKNGKHTELPGKTIGATGKIYLSTRVQNGKDISFLYSKDGKNYILLNEKFIDGSFLPPWDRAVRVGLISQGQPDQKAEFESFKIMFN